MRVEFLESFGDDEMIANVARVSYKKTADNYTEEQNAKLIKYLWEHKHTSPFRHPQVQFRIKCSIYVERQLFKHFVGVQVNSLSGRYVDFSDSYDRINVWRKQSTNSKQGSDGPLSQKDQAFCSVIEDSVISVCKAAYQSLLELGVSKEQARSILPLNLETEFIWTGSLQAFMHMCALRLKPDAQAETRNVVESMLYLLKETNKFPIALSLL